MTRISPIQVVEPSRRACFEPPRFLSREACMALAQQLMSYTSGQGVTALTLLSSWTGSVSWARNRIAEATDERNDTISIDRILDGGRRGVASTNQLDAQSLRAAVDWAETMLVKFGRSTTKLFNYPAQPDVYAATHIWSDTTYAQTPEQRSTIADSLIAGAEQAGMLSAGSLSVSARGVSFRTGLGLFLYAPQTIAECSMTVRDPQGTGSGWAGASSYDWARCDAAKLAAIALGKCLRSRNPVTIEPGRYTLILEPQAVHDLVRNIISLNLLRANDEDDRQQPFYMTPGQTADAHQTEHTVKFRRTKIGERIIDERISIGYEPTDIDLGVVPFDADGDAFAPVTWIDHGILTTLAFGSGYAQSVLRKAQGLPNSSAYKMSGGPTTIEEMVATTKRGLIVTRLSGVTLLDQKSMLCTGITRDGLWLIEDGKLSKPVKNLRFTESPLFALNNVEQLGIPVPVYSPGIPAVVPPIKVKDFSFTALVDAV